MGEATAQADRLANAYELAPEDVMVDDRTNAVMVPVAVLADLLDIRGAFDAVRDAVEQVQA